MLQQKAGKNVKSIVACVRSQQNITIQFSD